MTTTHKAALGLRVAVEITPERVLAGRRADRGDMVETYASRTLPAGTVTPNLTNANVENTVELRHAISDVLETLGGRARDVIAVVPDAAVRIALLDFETLPEKTTDAEAIIRFRLKKSVPFDVDRAAISYEAKHNSGGVRVVAALALTQILEEYENAFRDLAYSPGVVLPSTLAAMGAVETGGPTLIIKVDTSTTSVAIVDNDELLLFRTLENGGVAINPAQLADDVYPSLVFFQDTYGTQVERVLVGGLISAQQVSAALQSHAGVRAEELVANSYVGNASGGSVPISQLAGVVGALLS